MRQIPGGSFFIKIPFRRPLPELAWGGMKAPYPVQHILYPLREAVVWFRQSGDGERLFLCSWWKAHPRGESEYNEHWLNIDHTELEVSAVVIGPGFSKQHEPASEPCRSVEVPCTRDSGLRGRSLADGEVFQAILVPPQVFQYTAAEAGPFSGGFHFSSSSFCRGSLRFVAQHGI